MGGAKHRIQSVTSQLLQSVAPSLNPTYYQSEFLTICSVLCRELLQVTANCVEYNRPLSHILHQIHGKMIQRLQFTTFKQSVVLRREPVADRLQQ